MHKGPLGLSLEFLCFILRILVKHLCLLSIVFIVFQRGTKEHWVNTLPISKQNCVNFLKMIWV